MSEEAIELELIFGSSISVHWLTLCVNLTQARDIREEGASVEEMLP